MDLMSDLNFYLYYITQNNLYRGSDFSLKSKASGKKFIAVDLNRLPKTGLINLSKIFVCKVPKIEGKGANNYKEELKELR